MKKDFLKNFLEETEIPKWESGLQRYQKPVIYKHYLRFDKILLNSTFKELFLEKCIRLRRSKRKFKGILPSLNQLSRLLLYGCGKNIKDKKYKDYLRMYPSAGARYPLEVYAIINNKNKEINEGVYHYNVLFHYLERISGEVDQKQIKKILNQKLMEEAPLLIVITACFHRTAEKYGNRGLRYALIEAGHMAQNFYLICEELKLNCCAVGAFLDKELINILHIDSKHEIPLYVLAIGK